MKIVRLECGCEFGAGLSESPKRYSIQRCSKHANPEIREAVWVSMLRVVEKYGEEEENYERCGGD